MANLGAIFKKILPAIGAVATGNYPALIGMAAKAVSGAVGKTVGSSGDEIAAAISGATPEQLLALKKADGDLQLQFQQLGFENIQALEKIAADDRSSARTMQEQLKSKLPPALGLYVVVATTLAEGYILMHGIPAGIDPVIVGRILGTLDAALMLVLSYYFGSSAGSDRKTEILASGTQVNK